MKKTLALFIILFTFSVFAASPVIKNVGVQRRPANWQCDISESFKTLFARSTNNIKQVREFMAASSPVVGPTCFITGVISRNLEEISNLAHCLVVKDEVPAEDQVLWNLLMQPYRSIFVLWSSCGGSTGVQGDVTSEKLKNGHILEDLKLIEKELNSINDKLGHQ